MLLPIVVSSTVAVSVTVATPAVGSGVTLTTDVIGPSVSGAAVTSNVVDIVVPQLFALSLPCT